MEILGLSFRRLFHRFRTDQLRNGQITFTFIGLLLTSGAAQADQIDYNLHMVIHDYGKLVASNRACKLPFDETGLRDSVLDAVGADPNLDQDGVLSAMNRSVERRVLGSLGCSNASVIIAQRNFHRDMVDLRDAIAVAH